MALMNIYTCISSFLPYFYRQVVKSRGSSPLCGGLSLMGAAVRLLWACVVVPCAVVVTLQRIW